MTDEFKPYPVNHVHPVSLTLGDKKKALFFIRRFLVGPNG